jgi:protein-tyrosine phosphatase
MNSRLLPLEGAANVRDVGGHRSAFGPEVAPGRVLRGDALSRLTEADIETLGAVGLRTVVDFRLPGEVLVNGEDRLPPGATRVSLPVAGGELGAFYDLIASGQHRQQEAVLGQGRAAEFMRRAHRDFVADQRQRDGFGIALRMIADASLGLPLLYHCTSGKDRTGWMTAIVLTALGVPHADVMSDYLACNDIYQARYFKLSNDLAKTGMMRDPGLLRPILELSPGYLDAAFDEVWRRYGSFEAFLARGLDLDSRALHRLRGALLDQLHLVPLRMINVRTAVTGATAGRAHLRRPGLSRFSRHHVMRMNTTDRAIIAPMSVSQVLA